MYTALSTCNINPTSSIIKHNKRASDYTLPTLPNWAPLCGVFFFVSHFRQGLKQWADDVALSASSSRLQVKQPELLSFGPLIATLLQCLLKVSPAPRPVIDLLCRRQMLVQASPPHSYHHLRSPPPHNRSKEQVNRQCWDASRGGGSKKTNTSVLSFSAD